MHSCKHLNNWHVQRFANSCERCICQGHRSCSCVGSQGQARARFIRHDRWRSHCVQVKMHWVHENYWQPGPQGNDIQKTNVPNLRMRFRFDNHQEEVRRSLPSLQDSDFCLCVGHLVSRPVCSWL